MNWDQVRELQKDGFTFSSHTASHAVLTKLSAEDALVMARQVLAVILMR
ncbi:polysaccharide deacetylase family protein [Sporolituus thermophilus]|nr:polysaccharide deacetylase family protein [Sporolituus thermophilus]